VHVRVVKQQQNNSSSCRSNPGLAEGASSSESGGVWVGRSHMGNWKLPAPPQIFSWFYRVKHCVPGKVCSSLLGTAPSISPSSTSFARQAPLLSTPTQLASYL